MAMISTDFIPFQNDVGARACCHRGSDSCWTSDGQQQIAPPSGDGKRLQGPGFTLLSLAVPSRDMASSTRHRQTSALAIRAPRYNRGKMYSFRPCDLTAQIISVHLTLSDILHL
jgi:hypothetical protein